MYKISANMKIINFLHQHAFLVTVFPKLNMNRLIVKHISYTYWESLVDIEVVLVTRHIWLIVSHRNHSWVPKQMFASFLFK